MRTDLRIKIYDLRMLSAASLEIEQSEISMQVGIPTEVGKWIKFSRRDAEAQRLGTQNYSRIHD